MPAWRRGPTGTIAGVTPPALATRPDPVPDSRQALRAGLVSGVAYVMIGWRALLVPSLIRSVVPEFDQSDAGMGTYFLLTALAYASGSLVGGRLIRARGARTVLPLSALLMAAGLGVQGITGTWTVFLLAGVVVSVGASTADVGINALVLDLFPHARGRALNLLHVGYGAGALVAPLLLAFLVGLGVPWQWLMTGTGAVVLLTAGAMALTVPARPVKVRTVLDPEALVADVARSRRLPRFLLVMALSITCYVAAEAGVSDWLVRYLEELPVALASTALTLFWGGIAAGRLVFARVGNRLEPQGTAAVLAVIGSAVLALALLLPVTPASPLLFGLVGLAFGPIFPLIVAAAGARMPGHSATVTGTLIFAAVVGAVVYPPAIGFLSGAIGLQAAMLGTAVLALGSGLAAWAARRVGA